MSRICSGEFLKECIITTHSSNAIWIPQARLNFFLLKVLSGYLCARLWSCRWSRWWVHAHEHVNMYWLNVQVLPSYDLDVWHCVLERAKYGGHSMIHIARYWVHALANYSKSLNWWKEIGFIFNTPLAYRLDKWKDTRRGINRRLQLFLD
jgi:hypothetical protein